MRRIRFRPEAVRRMNSVRPVRIQEIDALIAAQIAASALRCRHLYPKLVSA
jgi:hypothetical protein